MEDLTPASAAELASVLKEASTHSRGIVCGGAFTKNHHGGPITAASERISTAGLDRVLEYEPKDLTISVEAGLPYSKLTGLLASHGQMLPLDPPYASSATIGGVVAANTCGSRRRLYGSARDFVIGMRWATMAGEIVESGGMVVKNVAGLDVQKTLIGSLGTLGVITSVNFKLAPLPKATQTFVLGFDSAGEVCAARDGVLKGVLQPAAVDVLTSAASERFGWGSGYCLLIRAGGSEALLARYGRELPYAKVLEGALETELWRGLDDFAAVHPFSVRVGHPLAALQAVLDSHAGSVLAMAGSGVAWLGFDQRAELDQWLAANKNESWSVIVEAAPIEEKATLCQWPEPDQDLSLMRALKELMDPKGLLNAGRLYGRL